MEGHRLGLPLAVGLAVVAAGAATLVLRPRHGLIHPAPVAAEAYFSPSELERARDYRGPQRLLGLGGLAIEAGTLGFLALRPPRRLRRALERGRARPIVAAAGAGAAFAVLLVVVQLPVSIPAEQRARDFGLSTQDWGGWTGDLLKSTGISMVLTAVGAMILMGVIRRFPRSWFALRAAGAGGREDPQGRRPPLPAVVVRARGGRRGGAQRGVRLLLAGADRPAVQQVRAAPRRARPDPGAATRRPCRGGRRAGLPRGCQPPH